MHSNEVIINVIDPQLGERRFVYGEPGVCIVGRAEDCDIHLPSDESHLRISRHHCLLEIDPPRVRLHDLGSTNGTYVNGEKIGRGIRNRRAPAPLPPNEFAADLRDGDEVQIAVPQLSLRVEVHSEK